MKKIAIITLNGYYNYGNRLQNYALQETLKGLGFDVETIINHTKFNKEKNSVSIIKKIRQKNINQLYRASLNKVKKHMHDKKLEEKRIERFKKFTFNYISETNYSISENEIPEDLSDRYNFFVVGSDQVWNPYFRKGSEIELLTFVPEHKRISYAASFGISEMPDKYFETYRSALMEMPSISVREHAGAEIVKTLTGKDVKVVLDPTMMLTKEKWISISKKPVNKPKKQYLLTYFLGDIPKKRMKQFKDIAGKRDLEIVHLSQMKDKTTYLTDPSEFIDYINSASLFCTDSFHGAAFSILLKTPFIVYDREGNSPTMNSRIQTLLKTFKLESRSAENMKLDKQIFEIDYSQTNSILEVERKKSFDYLNTALLARTN